MTNFEEKVPKDFGNCEAIILDTETTGFKRNEVIEASYIGVSLFKEPEELEGNWALNFNSNVAYAKRFSPNSLIEKGAERVHRIRMSDVKNCPKFSEGKLLLPDTVIYVIGHNIKYDLRAMQGISLAPICTIKIAKSYLKLRSYKLLSLAEHLLEEETLKKLSAYLHTSLGDVIITSQVLKQMVGDLGISTFEEMQFIGGV